MSLLVQHVFNVTKFVWTSCPVFVFNKCTINHLRESTTLPDVVAGRALAKMWLSPRCEATTWKPDLTTGSIPEGAGRCLFYDLRGLVLVLLSTSEQ